MNRFQIGLISALIGIVEPVFADSPLLPDRQKTPGDVLTTDLAVICVPGYTKTIRNVLEELKKSVYQLYGIVSRLPDEYEVDHLISLELGGANSLQNLWPQSYITQPVNAHVKDHLENKLHELICSLQISVTEAQQEIAQNWLAAYEKYIGPLPGEAKPAAELVPEQAMAITPESNAGLSPDEDGDCPYSAPVKISRKGLYHVPGEREYWRTKAKSCYTSAEAAASAGFRAPK